MAISISASGNAASKPDTNDGFATVLKAEQSGSQNVSRAADTLNGTDRSEKLRGTRGNDQITTGAGRDTVGTGRGDDRIIVDGSGDKRIFGGRGNDAVELSGSSSDYTISKRGGSTIYTSQDGSEIKMRGVELVFFSGSRELLAVGESGSSSGGIELRDAVPGDPVVLESDKGGQPIDGNDFATTLAIGEEDGGGLGGSGESLEIGSKPSLDLSDLIGGKDRTPDDTDFATTNALGEEG